MKSIAYRSGFKYALAEPYQDRIPIRPPEDIDTPWVRLSARGELLLRDGFAWDGPSGPTIDTASAMRGSAIHDAIYRLIRLRLLDPSCREAADLIYEHACKQDGMLPLRAWAHFRALRALGWRAAAPGSERPVLRAP